MRKVVTLAAFVLALVASLVPALPAGSIEDEVIRSLTVVRTVASEPGPAALSLLRRDHWIPPRGAFEVVIAVTTPDDDYTIEARVFDAVRSAEQVLDGTTGNRVLRRFDPVELDTGSAEVTITMAVVPDADGTPGDPLVLDPGVYPVRLDVVAPDGTRAGSLVTHLIRLPVDPAAGTNPRALPVALVVPVEVPPQRDRTGGVQLRPALLDPLEVRSRELARWRDVPMTVAVRPETVNALTEALTGDRGGDAESVLRWLTAALSGPATTITQPYVAVDAAAWAAAGAAGVVNAQLDLGRATLEAARLDPSGPAALIDGPLTAPLAAALAAAGVHRVVVPASSFAGTTLGGTTFADTSAGPVRVQGSEQLEAVPLWMVGGRESGGATVDAAYRTVAGLVADALAAGSTTPRPRALAVDAPPATDDTFLRVLLDALSTPGPLDPVTVDALFDGRASRPSRALAAPPAGPPAEVFSAAADHARVAAQLASVGQVVGDDVVLVVLRGRLMLAAARDLPEGQRRDLLAAATRQSAGLVVGLELPARETLVVTSHEATLPLALRNTSERTLRVAVQLRSPEVEFPGGAPMVLDVAPGSTDLEIPIRTRRSGQFDVEVLITSPDGQLELARSALRIQSRAISGVGLLLSGGAVLFLVVWWVRNHRKRRQGSATPSATVPEAPPEREAGEAPQPALQRPVR